MSNVHLIDDWSHAADVYNTIKHFGTLGYRGEPQEFSSCMARIDRISQEWPPLVALAGERYLIQRFRQDAAIYLNPVEVGFLQNSIQQLVVMRHFGAPTRLLDWTFSFWVALYFACASNPQSDGLIRYFDRIELEQVLMEDFQTETVRLSDGSMSPNDFFDQDVQSTFRSWVVPLYHTGPRFPRLIAQQGFFTMASRLGIDHWSFMSNQVLSSKGRIPTGIVIVRQEAKGLILTELRHMGISAATLFPGVEGVCTALSHEFEHLKYDDNLQVSMGILPVDIADDDVRWYESKNSPDRLL